MAETPDTDNGTPRNGGEIGRRALRLTRIALVISLALNLLVAGVVVGALIRGVPWKEGPRAGGLLRDPGLGPFYHALPDDERRAIAEALASRRAELEAERAALRAQLRSLLEAVRTEPFAADRLRALFAEQDAAITRRRALALELLIERLSAMSPAERARYADRLEALLRKPLRERERRDGRR
ncbi:Heavy-metal resistance [Meinhardsimonia xiamenensis]|jgi:uncharacterized coiled-coil protein SlyX|uniref:Heavy-metal resistance n=1 Tax=Meinhardsimonia xiamenensis TaxID=990712 RepID=A0A1G9B805_9RHOB|nr:periplasmic heavy metal sensor [Meinhardsimonia xiamenensis]PRX35085.1 heavy-metal resistance protein [Meinhardsimonia xiamenensis]SDK35613.1 Heavy-metal resistance [Meinhardsimonia xiamenensis]